MFRVKFVKRKQKIVSFLKKKEMSTEKVDFMKIPLAVGI